jgi:hypothetical protein
MRRSTVLAASAVFVVVATVASAGTLAITQQSIGGAKLGLSERTYKKLLGKPNFKQPVDDPWGRPSHWSRLVFARLSVYFAPKRIRGTVITTWDKGYKTAAGLGPCSTLSELKLAYGNRLKPSKFNTQHGVVFAYTLGKNLIFASENHSYVQTVGLYNGSDPHVGQPGGSLSWAGWITLSERDCHRD